jgi:hypothetical protein
MSFRTCEHYITNEKNSKNNHECFICYELKDEENQYPIQLLNQDYYSKMCSCNSYVHLICLHKWVILHNNCPICRKYIEKNKKQPISIIFIDSLNSTMTNILIVIRYVFLLFLVYSCISNYFSIMEVAKILEDNDKKKTEFYTLLEYDNQERTGLFLLNNSVP